MHRRARQHCEWKEVNSMDAGGVKRKRVLLLFMVLTFGPSCLFAQSALDVVYLNNGSLVRGVIIEQIPNQSIKIRTADGSEFVYAIDELARMTKEVAPSVSSLPAHRKSPLTAFALSLVF